MKFTQRNYQHAHPKRRFYDQRQTNQQIATNNQIPTVQTPEGARKGTHYKNRTTREIRKTVLGENDPSKKWRVKQIGNKLHVLRLKCQLKFCF